MKSGRAPRQFRRRAAVADDDEEEDDGGAGVPPVLAPAAVRAAAAKAKKQRQQQQQRSALSFGTGGGGSDDDDEEEEDEDGEKEEEDTGALRAVPSSLRKAKGMRASGVRLSSLVAKDEADLPRPTTLRAATGAIVRLLFFFSVRSCFFFLLPFSSSST